MPWYTHLACPQTHLACIFVVPDGLSQSGSFKFCNESIHSDGAFTSFGILLILNGSQSAEHARFGNLHTRDSRGSEVAKISCTSLPLKLDGAWPREVKLGQPARRRQRNPGIETCRATLVWMRGLSWGIRFRCCKAMPIPPFGRFQRTGGRMRRPTAVKTLCNSLQKAVRPS